MRISDWSADVCSSELCQLPSGDIAQTASCRIRLHDEHYSGSSPVITVTGAPVLPLCKLSAVTISVLPGLRIVKRFWRNSSGNVSRSRRSEELRVGDVCVSTFRSRGSPSMYTKNKKQ